MIVTDAWLPQVNGVVTTLGKIGEGLTRLSHDVHFVTPALFASIACPTYPEIRLSVLPYAGVRRQFETFAPDAVHIATEGPLGLAARRYCLKRNIAFTTAFHTRFAEYVHARIRVPVDLTYRWLRNFHAPSSAVMVPTPSVQRELQDRGFSNTVAWTRGVDTVTFSPGERDALEGRRPIFLYVGRVAVEKNIEAFLKLDLPGTKWVCGEGPSRAQLERRYPHVHFAGNQTAAQLARYYRAADVFVFPSLTDTFDSSCSKHSPAARPWPLTPCWARSMSSAKAAPARCTRTLVSPACRHSISLVTRRVPTLSNSPGRLP